MGKNIFGLMVAALLLGAPAKAAPTSELVVSSTRGVLLFSDTGSTISFAAGYHLSVVSGLQLGVTAEMLRVASGPSVTTASVLFGPTLNFPFGGSMVEDFFWNAGIGFSHVGSTRLLFQTSVGKRFHVIGPMTYRPSAGIQIVEGGSLTFLFHVVSFSVLF